MVRDRWALLLAASWIVCLSWFSLRRVSQSSTKRPPRRRGSLICFVLGCHFIHCYSPVYKTAHVRYALGGGGDDVLNKQQKNYIVLRYANELVIITRDGPGGSLERALFCPSSSVCYKLWGTWTVITGWRGSQVRDVWMDVGRLSCNFCGELSLVANYLTNRNEFLGTLFVYRPPMVQSSYIIAGAVRKCCSGELGHSGWDTCFICEGNSAHPIVVVN